MKYPEKTRDWHKDSQVLVLLSVADEVALRAVIWELPGWLDSWAFYEPDRDGELTALAVEPAGARFLSHLPLALKGGDEHE